MRLGLLLEPGREAELAELAERNGLFGVLAGDGDPVAGVTAAVYAGSRTDAVTVVARVALGREHPITIAEELAVLDNVLNGRAVVLADTAELDADAAAEEIELIRLALSCRFVRHRGPRFAVPAGIPSNAGAGDAISVTPKPVQPEVPVWVTGAAAARLDLPRLALERGSLDRTRLVQPALAAVTGDLAADRDAVSAWCEAGATHLFLRLPRGADVSRALADVSRYLIPEVAMPGYPRVASDASPPLPWTGP